MSCRSEDLLKLYKRRRAEGYDLPREAAPDYYARLDELQMYSSSSASQSAGGTSAPDADVVASSCAVGDDVDPGGTSSTCSPDSLLALDKESFAVEDTPALIPSDEAEPAAKKKRTPGRGYYWGGGGVDLSLIHVIEQLFQVCTWLTNFQTPIVKAVYVS